MSQDFTACEGYLLKLGTQLVFHSHASLHTHLVGVYSLLKRWGCPERVALAGLFHSIYSTDEFHDFALPLTLWLANNLDIKAREMKVNGTGVLKRANFYRQVAERLGDRARESWQEVYGVHVGGASDFTLEVRWHAARVRRILISRIKRLFGVKQPFRKSA